MIKYYNCKTYCCEDISLIENYDLAINDNTQTWHCHHKLEIDENKSIQQLIDENKYFNRPANELIFLTPYEHISLHGKFNSIETNLKKSWNRGKHLSNEHKRKIGESNNGKHNNYVPTKETKKKISLGLKGHKNALGKHFSEETKRKMSEAQKKRWDKAKKILSLH